MQNGNSKENTYDEINSIEENSWGSLLKNCSNVHVFVFLLRQISSSTDFKVQIGVPDSVPGIVNVRYLIIDGDSIRLYQHDQDKLKSFDIINTHILYVIKDPRQSHIRIITHKNIDSFIQEQLKVFINFE